MFLLLVIVHSHGSNLYAFQIDPFDDCRSPVDNNQMGSCSPEFTQKLKFIEDPEFGIGIVDMGLVRHVRCDESAHANVVTIILTSPFCPYIRTIVDEIKKASREFYPRRTIQVVVDMKTRWTPSRMTARGRKMFWGDVQ